MELIIPAVVGASGALVTLLADRGVGWLVELVGSHSEVVQEQVQQNAQNFMIRLAGRVERLEAEIPVSDKHIFEDALGHPSSSLLMQKALLSAAVTDNDDRHEILSELIAQRLTSGAEDMVALAGGAACDIVSALSSRQIKLLGLTARLFEIRPTVIFESIDQEQYDKLMVSWWNNIGDLVEETKDFNELDIRHLGALSCASSLPVTRNLSGTLALKSNPELQ